MASWEDELAALTAQRGKALTGYAYLLCGNRRDAEDVVQDALVKVFSRLRGRGWRRAGRGAARLCGQRRDQAHGPEDRRRGRAPRGVRAQGDPLALPRRIPAPTALARAAAPRRAARDHARPEAPPRPGPTWPRRSRA
ncbi:hypothetical protein NKG05_07925 [Oerskovia sp. M15]